MHHHLKISFFSICVVLCLEGFSQHQQDTLKLSGKDSIKVKKHTPARATLMSAILPGLGQVYNKKYWKLPIVYAGIGTSVYFTIWNRKNYRSYRQAYINKIDNDPATVDMYPTYSASQLLEFVKYYQKSMEISYIATAGFYLLNIIDANVDAHLFYFDVSDDLSLRIQPDILISGGLFYPSFGITLKL